MITLNIERPHIHVALDALESRRDAYLRTAAWYRGEADENFIIEEVRDEDEAESIAQNFEDAIAAIRAQLT